MKDEQNSLTMNLSDKAEEIITMLEKSGFVKYNYMLWNKDLNSDLVVEFQIIKSKYGKALVWDEEIILRTFRPLWIDGTKIRRGRCLMEIIKKI